MKFGLAINPTAEANRSDDEVLRDHLRLAVEAEDFGFESVFWLEHHFSGYALTPSPITALAYIAARTKSLRLGTGVLVLPWHNPMRLLGDIAVLEAASGGRGLYGFGRGRAKSEFDGLQCDSSDSLETFLEGLQIIGLAGRCESVTFEGQHNRLNRVPIRPRLKQSLKGRVFAATSNDKAVEIAGSLGFGLALSGQQPVARLLKLLEAHRQHCRAVDEYPAPMISVMVTIAEARSKANEIYSAHIEEDRRLSTAHYGNSSANVVHGNDASSDTVQRPFVTQLPSDIVGTADDCIERLVQLDNDLRPSRIIVEFNYGGMDLSLARYMIEEFATKVMPVCIASWPRNNL